MSRSNVSLSAERNALATFAAYPNKIFDYDGVLLTETDFSNAVTQCLYTIIRDYATEQATDTPNEIDEVILEERFANRFSNIYSAQRGEVASIIRSIKEVSPASDPSEYVKIVVAESIKRKSKSRLYDLVEVIDKMNEPIQIIQEIEKQVFDFTNATINCVDVENIAVGYDEYLADLAEEASRGNVQVGISTGLPNWDKAIGGGLRRGTINCIAARAGYGKSLMGANMAIHIASQNIPVLLMDTELNRKMQMNRFTSIDAKVPINAIETGRIFADQETLNKIQLSKSKLESLPIDYVAIKGWNIQQQISLIRRWIAKKVGRLPNGDYKQAVIILDYLKLLNEGDKGSSKEWEVLGYRMTALHDLMSQYGMSMVMFAQQNRAGLDRDDESTVSGSDRIIWLCDNFSVLFRLQLAADAVQAQEEADDEDQFPNMGIRVSKCRHGRGTAPGRFIGIYADKEDPRILEEQVCGKFVDKGVKVMTTN